MTLGHHLVLVILAAAVVAPLLAELPIRIRTPVVVFEVLLGILVGPHVLGLLRMDPSLSTMSNIGMAAVLFMAGMEIDFDRIRGRPLSLALRGWAASLVLAFLAVALLHVLPGVEAPLMVTIALTTTGLGTLLPILRDGGELESPFGRLVLATGTVGEVGPIVAVSLALSKRFSTVQEFGFLIAFLVLVALAATIGVRARPPRFLALLGRTLHASTQLPVRLAMLLLAALFFVSEEFGFEGILGAFAAGMIVGLATRGEEGRPFRVKIDAVCFGWLTPFFFVGTGIGFDLGALTRDAVTAILTPALLLIFLAVRGAPVLFHRGDLEPPERRPFALYSSVASLGLVVVITRIGLRTGNMNADIAQALIGAGLLSSLLYPTLARVGSPRTALAAVPQGPGSSVRETR